MIIVILKHRSRTCRHHHTPNVFSPGIFMDAACWAAPERRHIKKTTAGGDKSEEGHKSQRHTSPRSKVPEVEFKGRWCIAASSPIKKKKKTRCTCWDVLHSLSTSSSLVKSTVPLPDEQAPRAAGSLRNVLGNSPEWAFTAASKWLAARLAVCRDPWWDVGAVKYLSANKKTSAAVVLLPGSTQWFRQTREEKLSQVWRRLA